MAGRTLFEKLWSDHLVADLEDQVQLLYIDRVFLHERTGSIALTSLEDDQRSIRSPNQVFCVMDHILDTFAGRSDDTFVPGGADFIKTTRQASQVANIQLIDIDDPRQGIVHVVSPEQGIVQPGMTLVCPDSHTCSQGALGALAWGIGSSEAEHALATNTLRVSKPLTMRVNFEGELGRGVSAKDMMLHLIAQFGAAGGSGYAIEFAGSAVESLEIEARLTLCNMAVEFSAFTAVIAPDVKTYEYLSGRPFAPLGEAWDQAMSYWQTLFSEEGAEFDKEIAIQCKEIAPTVTWGNSPEHACAITANVPDLSTAQTEAQTQSLQRAFEYMGLEPGQALGSLKIDAAFIGSCTNSRLSDLRIAGAILKGKKIAQGIKAICVPGSSLVKAAAEAEGLDQVFINAGFEWRESGCSMCFFAGGESFGYRERVVSSTNRNFESRQGPETRTHLASAATVAASAIAGHLADPRVSGEGET
jgi:3-isopropylmalate/(R)-2-methylmalate dehydratase large subunit